jgi:predicted enzyme related to lactoylglutathione lyase
MNRLVHFEIHASQPQLLVSFYHDLFGWGIQQWGAMEYWLVTTGPADQPGINGAILPRRGAAPVDGAPVNAMVCTVDVTSVDESVSSALALGGTLAVAKMAIPTVGWLAYLKDPDGNIFGVMQTDAGAQ